MDFQLSESVAILRFDDGKANAYSHTVVEAMHRALDDAERDARAARAAAAARARSRARMGALTWARPRVERHALIAVRVNLATIETRLSSGIGQ